MHLTTIDLTIQFLRSKYKEFRRLDQESQAQIREFNTLVIGEKQIPLRELYIYLCMYDDMIRNDPQCEQTHLVPEKIKLEYMIQDRESKEETIVPCESFHVPDRYLDVYHDWEAQKISSKQFLKIIVHRERTETEKTDFIILFTLIEHICQ